MMWRIAGADAIMFAELTVSNEQSLLSLPYLLKGNDNATRHDVYMCVVLVFVLVFCFVCCFCVCMCFVCFMLFLYFFVF